MFPLGMMCRRCSERLLLLSRICCQRNGDVCTIGPIRVDRVPSRLIQILRLDCRLHISLPTKAGRRPIAYRVTSGMILWVSNPPVESQRDWDEGAAFPKRVSSTWINGYAWVFAEITDQPSDSYTQHSEHVVGLSRSGCGISPTQSR